MSTYSTVATPAPKDGPAAALAAHAAAVTAAIRPIAMTAYPSAVILPDGYHLVPIPLDLTPDRMRGTYRFSDVRDFAGWVLTNKESGDGDITTLWANANTITAVINDADGWGDHRGVLTLEYAPAWLRWSKVNRTFVSQEAFAELIEDGLAEIMEPDASTLLELVNEFHATADTSFTSVRRDSSGSTLLTFNDTVDGRSHSGSIVAPEKIVLFLPVYEGTEPFRLEARFRFRLDRSTRKVGFGIVMPRSNGEYQREAINAAAGQVTEITSLPVWRGVPADARNEAED